MPGKWNKTLIHCQKCFILTEICDLKGCFQRGERTLVLNSYGKKDNIM